MNFNDAIGVAFGQTSDFKGRSGRDEFWNFLVFVVTVVGTFLGVGSILGHGAGWFMGGIAALILLTTTTSLLVRRLHDVGRSGWWALLVLAPPLTLLVFAWCAMPGRPGRNAWGV